jgi:hypothetical protein
MFAWACVGFASEAQPEKDIYCLVAGGGVDCMQEGKIYYPRLPFGPLSAPFWRQEYQEEHILAEARDRGFVLASHVGIGNYGNFWTGFDVIRKDESGSNAPQGRIEVCIVHTFHQPQDQAIGCSAGVYLWVDGTNQTPPEVTMRNNRFVPVGGTKFLTLYVRPANSRQ